MTCVGQSNMQSSLVELSYFHWLVHGGYLHATRNGVSSDLPRHNISKCNVFFSVLPFISKSLFYCINIFAICKNPDFSNRRNSGIILWYYKISQLA